MQRLSNVLALTLAPILFVLALWLWLTLGPTEAPDPSQHVQAIQCATDSPERELAVPSARRMQISGSSMVASADADASNLIDLVSSALREDYGVPTLGQLPYDEIVQVAEQIELGLHPLDWQRRRAEERLTESDPPDPNLRVEILRLNARAAQLRAQMQALGEGRYLLLSDDDAWRFYRELVKRFSEVTLVKMAPTASGSVVFALSRDGEEYGPALLQYISALRSAHH